MFNTKTISLKLNGETREVSAVVFGASSVRPAYYMVRDIAIKTPSGKTLHCGSVDVDSETMKVTGVNYQGALGNGSGFGSKSFWLDWADKYTIDQFSKATRHSYPSQNKGVQNV